MKRILHALIAALAVLAVAAPVQALNVQLLRPSTGAVQGYQLFTSETLPKYDLATGIAFNYVQHPLEVGRFGGNQRKLGIVDRFITADALISFGATDWMMVNLDIPFNIYHNIAPVFIPQRDTGGPDMGDIELNLKFRIFDAWKTSSHLGLAIVPFVTLPTGRQSIYFGDENVTGGLWLVGDTQWKANRFYLNLGARFRETEQIANLVVKHEFLYGAGFQRPLWKKGYLDIIVETYGSTTFSKFFTEEISSPFQAHLLLQKKWLSRRQLIANLGGGMGFTNGYGAPDFRFMTGVSYLFELKRNETTPAETAVAAPRDIVLEGVNFETASAALQADSKAVLDNAIATIDSMPYTRITITGHTDNRGKAEANRRLSERRAESIKAYFVEKGIDGDRIETAGIGDARPASDNATPAGRAKNRRIELKLE